MKSIIWTVAALVVGLLPQVQTVSAQATLETGYLIGRNPDHLVSLTTVTGGAVGRLIYTRAGSYYGVKGSPYMNEGWVNGIIYDDRARQHENPALMYNAHYDLIEAIVGQDTLILDSRKITKVEMPFVGSKGDVRSVVLKNGYANDRENIAPHMFFEVLHEGAQITVLKKHFKELKKSDFTPGYHSGSSFDEFHYLGTLYVQKAGGNIEKIRANKKGILSQFGSKSKQVEAFVKKEGLDYDDDSDIARIFAYFDSLLPQ